MYRIKIIGTKNYYDIESENSITAKWIVAIKILNIKSITYLKSSKLK